MYWIYIEGHLCMLDHAFIYVLMIALNICVVLLIIVMLFNDLNFFVARKPHCIFDQRTHHI